jgi:hypothetical protein
MGSRLVVLGRGNSSLYLVSQLCIRRGRLFSITEVVDQTVLLCTEDIRFGRQSEKDIYPDGRTTTDCNLPRPLSLRSASQCLAAHPRVCRLRRPLKRRCWRTAIRTQRESTRGPARRKREPEDDLLWGNGRRRTSAWASYMDRSLLILRGSEKERTKERGQERIQSLS